MMKHLLRDGDSFYPIDISPFAVETFPLRKPRATPRSSDLGNIGQRCSLDSARNDIPQVLAENIDWSCCNLCFIQSRNPQAYYRSWAINTHVKLEQEFPVGGLRAGLTTPCMSGRRTVGKITVHTVHPYLAMHLILGYRRSMHTGF